MVYKLARASGARQNGVLSVRGTKQKRYAAISEQFALTATWYRLQGCGDVLTKKVCYTYQIAWRNHSDRPNQKLDPHRNQCRGASFSCLDCMVHFQGTEYRSHTSCISEAQKYQGKLYRGEKQKGGGDKRKSTNGHHQDNSSNPHAMVPRNAYVEDAPEGDDSQSQAVAMVDVPPAAPTPPPPQDALPAGVNVFDFLVSEETPSGSRKEMQASEGAKAIESQTHANGADSQYSQFSNGDGSQFMHYGFSYGYAPVQPTFERYDSWQNMTESQQPQGLAPPPYTTPAPRNDRADRKDRLKSEKSDKKRKRHHVEDLDLSSSKRPTSRGNDTMTDAPSAGRTLHTGLTGGLARLVTDPDFYSDRIQAGPTPISPLKRTKHDRDVKDARRKSSYTSYSTTTTKTSRHAGEREKPRSRSQDRDSHHRRSRRGSSSSPESRHRSRTYKTIEYPDRPSSVQPTAHNQISVQYRSKAELFLSFVTKGPESERGCSMNKALKRYHREREVRGETAKEEDDKELWKSLRMRRNSRGEIVVFVQD